MCDMLRLVTALAVLFASRTAHANEKDYRGEMAIVDGVSLLTFAVGSGLWSKGQEGAGLSRSREPSARRSARRSFTRPTIRTTAPT